MSIVSKYDLVGVGWVWGLVCEKKGRELERVYSSDELTIVNSTKSLLRKYFPQKKQFREKPEFLEARFQSPVRNTTRQSFRNFKSNSQESLSFSKKTINIPTGISPETTEIMNQIKQFNELFRQEIQIERNQKYEEMVRNPRNRHFIFKFYWLLLVFLCSSEMLYFYISIFYNSSKGFAESLEYFFQFGHKYRLYLEMLGLLIGLFIIDGDVRVKKEAQEEAKKED